MGSIMTATEPTRRDLAYLKLVRAGTPVPQVAKKFRVTAKTVYNGLERARLAEKPTLLAIPRPPRLELLSPITPLVPQSECPHRGPMKRGSVFVCAVCHASGMDHHPALRRDPRTDPKPERRKWSSSKLKGGVGA